jgi:hypothetical protein
MPATRYTVTTDADGVPRHKSPTNNGGAFGHMASWLRPHRPIGNETRESVALSDTLPAKACAWCIPWSNKSFPGHYVGILSILGLRSASTLKYWKHNGQIPAWAARRLASYIRTRATAGVLLAEQLEAHATLKEAEPSKVTQLRKPRPVRDA